jgi:hypothetical protein
MSLVRGSGTVLPLGLHWGSAFGRRSLDRIHFEAGAELRSLATERYAHAASRIVGAITKAAAIVSEGTTASATLSAAAHFRPPGHQSALNA